MRSVHALPGSRNSSRPADWFMAALAAGMKRLLSLSLDRTPAAELLGQTTETWADALWPGRDWHESDTARIAEAFRRMSDTCEQWPSPKVFRANLPARADTSLLGLPSRAFTDAERRENLDLLFQVVNHALSGTTATQNTTKETQP